MENRLFLPQDVLDRWLMGGVADLRDGELTLGTGAGGRRFRVTEGCRVLREIAGGGPAAEALVGRVKSRAQLEEIGAEIVETSMLIGDAAYDIEPGWICVAVGPFADFVATATKRGAAWPGGTEPPKDDEELLARLLAAHA